MKIINNILILQKPFLIIALLMLCSSINPATAGEFKKVHFAYDEYISEIVALDSNTCFAFAFSFEGYTHLNVIYRSDDKGKSWTKIYVKDVFYDSLRNISRACVANKDNLYYSYTTQMAIAKSDDGGETFRDITFGEFTNEIRSTRSFKMYNENIGIIASYHELVYTFDGWDTFKIFELEKKNKFLSEPAFFLDSNNIVFQKDPTGSEFVKFNLKNETFEIYNDAQEHDEGEEPFDITDVFFLNDSLGFACGGQEYGVGYFSTDVIWKTHDKGKTWEIVFENLRNSTFSAHTIRFGDDRHGIAVGSWGKIILTLDGGYSWFYPEIPKELDSFFTRGECIGDVFVVSTESGGIYRYERTTGIKKKERDKSIVVVNDNEIVIALEDSQIVQKDLIIFDLIGNEVLREKIIKGRDQIVVSVEQLNKGLYFYMITGGETAPKRGTFLISR